MANIFSGSSYYSHKSYIYFFLITILFFHSSSVYSQNNVVTISTGEWPPFSSENLPNYGIGLHLITAAYAKVNLKVEYSWYPWPRAMRVVGDSNADVSGMWYYNDDRARQFVYSDPFVFSKNVFFYHKDSSFDWDGFDNFPPDAVVGIARGYSYGAEFDDAVKSNKVKTGTAGNDLQNIKKLLARRIDAYPSDELVAKSIMRQSLTSEEIATLKVHPKAINQAGLHVITAKNNPRGLELVKKFNEGMALLISSGEYEKIMSEYR